MAQALAELTELSSVSPPGEAYIVSILTIGSLLTRGSSIFNTVPPFSSSHSLLFSVFGWRVNVDNQIYITDCLTVNPKLCVLSLVSEYFSFSFPSLYDSCDNKRHFFPFASPFQPFRHSCPFLQHVLYHPKAHVIEILIILHIAPATKLSLLGKVSNTSCNYAEIRFTSLMFLSTDLTQQITLNVVWLLETL